MNRYGPKPMMKSTKLGVTGYMCQCAFLVLAFPGISFRDSLSRFMFYLLTEVRSVLD